MVPPKEDWIHYERGIMERTETTLGARRETKKDACYISSDSSNCRKGKRKRKSAFKYDDYDYECSSESSNDQNPLHSASESWLDILCPQPVFSSAEPFSTSLALDDIPSFIANSKITSYLTLYTPSCEEKPHTTSLPSSEHDNESGCKKPHTTSTLPGSEYNNDSNILKYILEELKQLRSTQEIHTQILNALMEKTNLSASDIICPQEFHVKLPAADDLELIEIESMLDDSNFKSELFSRLQAIGGNDYKDHARRCLRHLMVDSVAELYSWVGSKEKQSFSSLKILDVLIDAVRHNQKFVTKHQVEDAIKNWLKHARERIVYSKRKK